MIEFGILSEKEIKKGTLVSVAGVELPVVSCRKLELTLWKSKQRIHVRHGYDVLHKETDLDKFYNYCHFISAREFLQGKSSEFTWFRTYGTLTVYLLEFSENIFKFGKG